MKPRNTLIALVVLLAAGAWIYFGEMKGEEKKKAHEEAIAKVWDVHEDQISALTIARGDKAVVLSKEKEGWRIASPIAVEADAFTPGDVAHAVADLKKESTVDEAPSADALKGFGLEPPSSRVTWKCADGKTGEVDLGRKSPIGDSTYARVAGKAPVFLVAATTASALDKDLLSLRNKKLLDFQEDAVSEIDLFAANQQLHLKKDKGHWRLTAPVADLAREETVRSLLSALRFLEAIRFVSDDGKDLVKYGLESPPERVTLTIGPAASTQTLLAGLKAEGEENAYVKRAERPSVAIVASTVLTDLQKTEGDLREKSALPFDRWDCKQLDVSAGPGGFRLTQPQSGEWNVAEIVGGKAGPAQSADWRAVDDYLKAVTDLPVDKFLDAPPADLPLDPPTLTLSVITGKETAARTFRISGPAKDGTYVVRDPERTFVLQVAADARDKVQKSAKDFFTHAEEKKDANGGAAAPAPPTTATAAAAPTATTP